MSPLILNRDFQHPADGWYQIEPKGYHPAKLGDEKVVQVIDAKAISSIVNRFNGDAEAASLRHGSEMLIDREHFKYDQDKDTEAMGWGQQLLGRGDGVYARNRWTDLGQEKIDGGRYRYFSTEYDPADLEDVPASEIPADILNKFKGRRFVRPLRLDGLTLTNMPNNRGARPITNRTSQDDPASPPAGKKEADTKTHLMKNLIANRLNVSADAPDEAFVRGVALVCDERDTLKTENIKLTNRLADSFLKSFVTISPGSNISSLPADLTFTLGGIPITVEKSLDVSRRVSHDRLP